MVNKNIKNAIDDKNAAFELYLVEKTISQFKASQSFPSRLTDLINNVKGNYYSRLSKQLMGRNVSPATYWSTLKTFLNNKKIPCLLQYFTKTSLL